MQNKLAVKKLDTFTDEKINLLAICIKQMNITLWHIVPKRPKLNDRPHHRIHTY